MKKPNVLFIMTDQQRADTIGSDRHRCANYPRMEQLAEESVRFTEFHTAATACVASRMSFLTGQHAWQTRARGNHRYMTGDETTWMSILREQGYRCVSIGKTHMVHAGSTHIQTPVGNSYGDQRDWDIFSPAPSPESEENYFDILATRQACSALRVFKEAGNPFAMFFGLHAPHPPFVMPERYLDFCKPEDVPLPIVRGENELQEKPNLTAPRSKHVANAIDNALDGKVSDIHSDESIRKAVSGYFSILKMVDDCLGMILDEMQTLGLLDNTIIVYSSDHGEMLGEHWIYNKGINYDVETRIPFMVRFPDRHEAGRQVSGLASSIDFVPTLLDILGVESAFSFPGRSLVPMIGSDEKQRDHVICCDGVRMMLRTETHKICYDPRKGVGEMYDLLNDPDELKDLYNDTEYSALRAELLELMLRSRMQDDIVTANLTKHDRILHDEARATLELEMLCDCPAKFTKQLGKDDLL